MLRGKANTQQTANFPVWYYGQSLVTFAHSLQQTLYSFLTAGGASSIFKHPVMTSPTQPSTVSHFPS